MRLFSRKSKIDHNWYADRIWEAVDLFAAKVKTKKQFASWKIGFEAWRGETWDRVERDMGRAVRRAYQPIGYLSVSKELSKESFNAVHAMYRACLQVYLTRIRGLLEIRGLNGR